MEELPHLIMPTILRKMQVRFLQCLFFQQTHSLFRTLFLFLLSFSRFHVLDRSIQRVNANH